MLLVGDIHGCLEEFEELLRTAEYNRERDRLVLLGDLVDRGPDPVGVVRRARELGAESVLGNHEEKHLRFRRHEAKKATNAGYKNPMKPFTDQRLKEHLAYSEADWAYIEAMPITIQLPGNWLAVHAGLENGIPFEKQRADKMIRVRYVDDKGSMKAISSDTNQPNGTRQWAEVCEEPRHIAYGHMALNMAKPVFGRFVQAAGFAAHAEGHDDLTWYRAALDTACCFGGTLSALILSADGVLTVPPEEATVSAKAKGTYAQLCTDRDDA